MRSNVVTAPRLVTWKNGWLSCVVASRSSGKYPSSQSPLTRLGHSGAAGAPPSPACAPPAPACGSGSGSGAPALAPAGGSPEVAPPVPATGCRSGAGKVPPLPELGTAGAPAAVVVVAVNGSPL